MPITNSWGIKFYKVHRWGIRFTQETRTMCETHEEITFPSVIYKNSRDYKQLSQTWQIERTNTWKITQRCSYLNDRRRNRKIYRTFKKRKKNLPSRHAAHIFVLDELTHFIYRDAVTGKIYEWEMLFSNQNQSPSLN